MLRFVAIAAVALGLAAAPVLGAAERHEVAVAQPVQPANLTGGRLDVVVYYVEHRSGDFDVTATFIDRAGRAEPVDVRLTMQPGDTVSFRVPGYPEARFHFARIGHKVIARVEIERLSNA